MGFSSKLFLSFGILLILPICLFSFFSFHQLRNIQQVSFQGMRKALIASQVSHTEDLLSVEAKRLSLIFFRVKNETRTIAHFAKGILATPSRFKYQNGSTYDLKEGKRYIMPAPDGNSSLYLFKKYHPAMLPPILATESMDLLWKSIAKREPMLDDAWLIDADGFSRTFPWQNFNRLKLPHGVLDSQMPFFYLAGKTQNPEGKAIFTPVYKDPLTHKYMVSCVAPITIKGEHQATVGIDITLQRLREALSEIRITKSSSSLLFSGSEIVAASSNLPLKTLGLNPDLPSFGQDLYSSTDPQVLKLTAEMWQKEVFLKRLTLHGKKFFVGAAEVKPLKWRIIYIVPEADVILPAYKVANTILAKTNMIRENFIHILLFSFFLVCGIIFYVLNHQAKGLRVLLGGIREFGHGNLSHRLPEDSSEFGKLGEALNSMAQSLLEKKKELKRIYGEVERERKLSAVGRLAAGVAHEVNNPLGTISTHTQMLLRRPDLPEEAQGNLKKVMGEIRRIQNKMRNLLDLSRIQSPIKSEVNPNILIDEVVGLAKHEAAARGVVLESSLAPDSRKILVDRSGFKQVLWNLLGNAIDAQDRGGRVTVHTHFQEAPPQFLLEVEDTGSGIPENLMEQIFEPFFTTKEVGQGTGLGLATVFSIVQAHGGKIDVTNLTPRGCRFRVVLPEQENNGYNAQ